MHGGLACAFCTDFISYADVRENDEAPAEIASLIALLEHGPLPGIRLEAAQVLGARGEEARPGVPALIAALGDESKDVREAAASSLRKIQGPPSATTGYCRPT